MKQIVLPCLAVTLLATLTVQRAEAQEEKRKIAVLTLRLDTELDEGIGKTLNEILLNEFQDVGNLHVLSSSDILSVLNMAVKRTKLGCNDDSCLVELGGALGVPLLASPSIGAVGNKYVVNLKVMDIPRATVLARSSEIVNKDDSELIKAVKKSVAKVVGIMGLEKKATPVPVEVADSPAVTAEPDKRPAAFMDIAPWVSLGLTIAAGGAAATVAGLARQDAWAAKEEYKGTSAWRDDKEAFETKALTADVLLGIAGVAAVTTVVLFVIGNGDEEPESTVSVAPTTGGGMATYSVRF